MKLKSIVWIGLILACILSFASCSGGIKGEEAKAHINHFFDAVSAEDYEKAETLLHPQRPYDLEEFFRNAEKETGIDFGQGIEIRRYTDFSFAYYDSEVAGSTYELTMDATVGEQAVEFEIEIVKNESGFGIYNLELDTTP